MKTALISEIIVEDRARRNHGSLDSLERSIQLVGVIQSIGITPDKHLIFGGRRLQACKNIGLKTIPVRVFDIAADDPVTALRMEREENEHRLDLTPSEKIALGMKIEEANSGRRGNPTGANQYSTGKAQNFAENHIPQGESREIAAKAVDMNRETYRQAKAVVNSGNEEVIQQMDSGEKSINAAYKSVSKPAPTPTLKPAPTHISEPEPKPVPELFKPKTFKITLCSNPEGDAKELLARGGKDYCTKLAIAILKAAGHNITDDEN